MLLIGFMSINLSAQEKNGKIIQLFELMRTEKRVNSMVDNMSAIFNQKSSELKNTQNDSIKTIYRTYVMDETKAFTKKLLNEDMVELYDKYFTIEEIQKFIDFYNTPEAKKLLDVTPNIQEDLMTNVRNKYLPDLREKFKKKFEELNKK